MHTNKYKYKNKIIIFKGIHFQSKKEANRYAELLLLEKVGKISEIKLQVSFILQEKFIYRGNNIRQIKYISDFTYIEKDNNSLVVEDTKGFRTEVFKLKAKLLKLKYPDIDFREI